MDDEIKAEIQDWAVGGLLIDGAHHKQWYLERILLSLGINLVEFKKEIQKDGYDWEKGIAP
jgi:hypothetical protein